MVREEMLFDGQAFLELEDWPLMNDYDIAVLIGIHAKDFTFYFGTKHDYEREVLDLYAKQHLLDAKTRLSCCFRRPTKRVKKYLIYLTLEYTLKPNMTDILFFPLAGSIQHRIVSTQFLNQLTKFLANCLKETIETIRLESEYLETYSREIIKSHLCKLKKMNREEMYSFSQKIRKNNELLKNPK